MRTPVDAIVFAKRYINCAVGICLWYVQHWFGTSHRYPSAIAQWSAAKRRHAGDRNPPAGVPVYWSGGQYGHVALSLGGGRVRSTDWPSRGRVGECTIDELSRAWGKTYLGWSEDLADVVVWTAPPKPKPITVTPLVLKRGMKSPAVKRLQAGLLRVFPAYAGPIKTNGGPIETYGPATEKVVKEFQRRAGLKVTGVVDAKTRTALAGYGVKI